MTLAQDEKHFPAKPLETTRRPVRFSALFPVAARVRPSLPPAAPLAPPRRALTKSPPPLGRGSECRGIAYRLRWPGSQVSVWHVDAYLYDRLRHDRPYIPAAHQL